MRRKHPCSMLTRRHRHAGFCAHMRNHHVCDVPFCTRLLPRCLHVFELVCKCECVRRSASAGLWHCRRVERGRSVRVYATRRFCACWWSRAPRRQHDSTTASAKGRDVSRNFRRIRIHCDVIQSILLLARPPTPTTTKRMNTQRNCAHNAAQKLRKHTQTHARSRTKPSSYRSIWAAGGGRTDNVHEKRMLLHKVDANDQNCVSVRWLVRERERARLINEVSVVVWTSYPLLCHIYTP